MIHIGHDEAAREAVRELRKPIYHQHDPSIVRRILNWSLDQVGRLLAHVIGAAPGGGWGLLVIGAVLVGLVVLVGWLVGPPTRAHVTSREVFRDGPLRSAAEHATAAAAAAAAGRWNEAVQERFRALVRGLEERDLIEAAAGRTADEAMAAAGALLLPLAAPLRDAAGVFDDVTYGDHAGDADAYQRLTELERSVRQARPGTTVLVGSPAGFGMPR